MTPSEITWQAPEFEERPKSVSWYWASIIAAVLIIGFSVWRGNFLFGFFIVIAEILLVVWGNQTPRLITFSLSEKELRVGPRIHAFRDIEYFSVNEPENSLWGVIAFRFKQGLHLPLLVHVPKERMPEVEAHLAGSLPQREHEESFLDTLEKFFGF